MPCHRRVIESGVRLPGSLARMGELHVAFEERSLREVLARCLADLDLSSVDGRAGLGAMMRQLEQEAPGHIQASAARLQLKALSRSERS